MSDQTIPDITVEDLIAYRLKQKIDQASNEQEHSVRLALYELYVSNEIDVKVEDGEMLFCLSGTGEEETPTDDNDSTVVITDI